MLEVLDELWAMVTPPPSGLTEDQRAQLRLDEPVNGLMHHINTTVGRGHLPACITLDAPAGWEDRAAKAEVAAGDYEYVHLIRANGELFKRGDVIATNRTNAAMLCEVMECGVRVDLDTAYEIHDRKGYIPASMPIGIGTLRSGVRWLRN